VLWLGSEGWPETAWRGMTARTGVEWSGRRELSCSELVTSGGLTWRDVTARIGGSDLLWRRGVKWGVLVWVGVGVEE